MMGTNLCRIGATLMQIGRLHLNDWYVRQYFQAWWMANAWRWTFLQRYGKKSPLSSGWWFYRAEPGSWIIKLYTHLKWRCHISIAARLVARYELGQFRLKIPCSPWCAVVACGACPYFCSAWDGSDCRYGGFLKRTICSQPVKATKQ